MSDNVVVLSSRRIGQPELVSALTVFYALRTLWVAGELQQDAYILGGHAVAKMYRQGTRDCALVPSDAFKTLVKMNGKTYLGPLRMHINEQLTWIHAAQDLHFAGGVMSHYDQNALDEPDAAERHFTRSPLKNANSLWSMDAPVFFRLPPMTQDDFNQEVALRFQEGLGKVDSAIEIAI